MEINLQELMEESREGIKRQILESIKNDLSWTIRHELEIAIKPIVTEFMVGFGPEVRETLLGEKSKLLEESLKEVVVIAKAVAKTLSDTMTKNLADSYKSKKVIEALMSS